MAGRICRIALAAIAACAPAAASPQDDDAPPALVAVGSDGMGPLLRAWAEDLAHADPGFVLEVETLGSSTALPALVSGRADVGAMTREMKWAEREVFRSRYGYDPVRVRVALDAVMVFVHPKNSIESLDLAQLDAIYSHTRRCGAEWAPERWEDVCAVGEWAGRAILPCGRGRRSGTRGFFRQHALCGGHFREDVREQPGAGSVVRFVAEGLCGIGYGGLSGPRDGVRAIAIGAEPGSVPAPPIPAAIYAGSYPLARFLNLYVNREPGRSLPARIAGLLRYALSDPGQERVREAGYLPLPGELQEQELTAIGAPD